MVKYDVYVLLTLFATAMRIPYLTIVLSTITISLLSACGTTSHSLKPSATSEASAQSSRTHQSTPKHSAPTKAEAKAENEQYHERIAIVARDIRAICTAPANQLYYTRTPCLPAGMTEAHLRDPARLTAQAQVVTKRIFDQLHQLNEETRALMMASGDPDLIRLARRSREVGDPQIKNIQDALLSGKITWGEYNRARLEIFETSSKNSATDH